MGTSANNGHYHPKSPKTSNNKQQRSSKVPCPPFPQILTLLLGLLVIVTVVIDNYYLLWSNALQQQSSSSSSSSTITRSRKGKQRASYPDDRSRGNHRSSSSHNNKHTVGGWMTRRKFAFQDVNQQNNLPSLKKANKNFTVVPKTIKETQKTTKASLTAAVQVQPNEKEEATKVYGKEPILRIFQQAGIPPLHPDVLELLPTWDQVIRVIGPRPVIDGLDRCQTFRETVPAVERMLGSSGMFNTGTNLVTHLLKNNCKIPERVEKYGWEASREAHG
jgi:hypothetical protein